MNLSAALSAGVAAILLSAPAGATEVLPYTVISLTSSDATQQGRLTRARPPSDWSTMTPFPGITNAGVTYQYRTVDAVFAPNASQDIYYEITVDDPDAVIFASAYNRTYDPLAPEAGYLGDEGSSGNYFPGDPSYFDVVVPAGGALRLVFNSVGADAEPFAYQVSAFSDTMYGEDFAAPGVPEPALWAMFIAGFGLTGSSLRRRRSSPSTTAFGSAMLSRSGDN